MFKLVLSNDNDSPLSSDSNVVTETTTVDPNTGKKRTKVSVNGDVFSSRRGLSVVVFDDKIWIEKTKDVTTRFSGRYGHAAAAFDGKLWVVGGYGYNGDQAQFCNDVWSSSDGKNWTKKARTGFSARNGHAVAVFDDKLWVIGGYIVDTSGFVVKNDVWHSP